MPCYFTGMSFFASCILEITITSKSCWISESKKLLDIIHERTKKFTSEEIEADITQAYKEVRQR